jgi:ketosteroid isomerase-like protein
MSQENVELVRQGFEALNRDDRATATRLLAPDVEWHSVAGPLFGVGTIRGREAVLKFLWQDLRESIEGFRARPEEFTDLGTDRVLVVARYEGRGRSSGAEVDLRVASVYQLRDGMMATVHDYTSREEAFEAAGLEE